MTSRNRTPSPFRERFDVVNAATSARTAPRSSGMLTGASITHRRVCRPVAATRMNSCLSVAAVPAVRLNDSAGASTRSSTRSSTASALARCRRVWSVRCALVRVRTRRAERHRRRRQQRHDRRSQRPRRRACWGSRAPVTTNTSVGAASRRTHCGTVTSSPRRARTPPRPDHRMEPRQR